MAGAQDGCELRCGIEAFDVRGVVTRKANRKGRRCSDEGLVRRMRDVARARPVTHFALHVLELVDVRDSAAAGAFVARHVARNTLEVELFVLGGERLVRVCVRGTVPDATRSGVTARANVDTDVACLSRGGRGG